MKTATSVEFWLAWRTSLGVSDLVREVRLGPFIGQGHHGGPSPFIRTSLDTDILRGIKDHQDHHIDHHIITDVLRRPVLHPHGVGTVVGNPLA